MVKVVLRKGSVEIADTQRPRVASYFSWGRKGDGTDIFAYRTVIEPKTRTVWLCWHEKCGIEVYHSYEDAMASKSPFRISGPKKVTLTEGEIE